MYHCGEQACRKVNGIGRKCAVGSGYVRWASPGMDWRRKESTGKGPGTIWEVAVVATGSTNTEQGSLTSVDGGTLQCQRRPLVTSQAAGAGSWQKRCREERGLLKDDGGVEVRGWPSNHRG